MYFSQSAAQVVMLVRGDSLEAKMSAYLVTQLRRTCNVEVREGVEVTACGGSEHLEYLTLRDRASSVEHDVPASFPFCFIGASGRWCWTRAASCLPVSPARVGARRLAAHAPPLSP